MKTIRYAFWALVGLCLILIGLANDDIVTLRAMPPAVSDQLGISPQIDLPLFVAIFIGVGLGLLIGFLWEWLREHRIRSHGRTKEREANALRQEVAELRAKTGEGADDVLALLDSPST